MSKYVAKILSDTSQPLNLDGNIGYGCFDSIFEFKAIVDLGGEILTYYEIPFFIEHWSDDDLQIFYTWLDIKADLLYSRKKVEENEIEKYVDMFLDKNGLERMLFLEQASIIYSKEMCDLDSFDAYNIFVEATKRQLFKKKD